MELNIFNSLTIISLFLNLILCVFFMFNKKGNRNANITLSLLLFVFLNQIISSFTTSNWDFMYFMNYHKIILLIRITALLTGPLLFNYIMQMLGRKVKNLYLHAFPFLAAIVIAVIYTSKFKEFILWETAINVWITITILIHNGIYFIASFLIIKRSSLFKEKIVKSQSTVSYFYWVQFLLVAFICVWMVGLYAFASYTEINHPKWCAFTSSIYGLVFFCIICITLIILLIKPDIYLKHEKYKYSTIDPSTKSYYIRILSEYMNVSKSYLNPELRISDVADNLELPKSLLSQIINEEFNVNFKLYLTKFRIEYFINELGKQTNPKHTISELMFQSGFNSKSVFNTSFKNQTGYTPLEYKKKFIQNQN